MVDLLTEDTLYGVDWIILCKWWCPEQLNISLDLVIVLVDQVWLAILYSTSHSPDTSVCLQINNNKLTIKLNIHQFTPMIYTFPKSSLFQEV